MLTPTASKKCEEYTQRHCITGNVSVYVKSVQTTAKFVIGKQTAMYWFSGLGSGRSGHFWQIQPNRLWHQVVISSFKKMMALMQVCGMDIALFWIMIITCPCYTPLYMSCLSVCPSIQ